MSEFMYNSDYLCHFNKNHSPKNGQFVSGDGDGDGQVDDHGSKKIKFGSADTVKGSINPRNPKNSSAGLKATNKKLSKSSIFRSSSAADFKNPDGTIDNKSYTISGLKKLGVGSALMVGGILTTKLAPSTIAKGAGFVSAALGGYVTGYGGSQTAIGVANTLWEKNVIK